jgi:transcriptional regulator with XRE-family HTH domain
MNSHKSTTPNPPASPTSADALNVLAWLERVIEETPETRAIEEEELAKYHLAIALTRAREAAGHTQSTLALELGVRQSLVSRWEHINHNHTIETLLKLMQATGAKLVLGVEVDGEYIAVTPTAERSVVFSEQSYNKMKHQAETAGLTVRELLLASLASQKAAQEPTGAVTNHPYLEHRRDHTPP